MLIFFKKSNFYINLNVLLKHFFIFFYYTSCVKAGLSNTVTRTFWYTHNNVVLSKQYTIYKDYLHTNNSISPLQFNPENCTKEVLYRFNGIYLKNVSQEELDSILLPLTIDPKKLDTNLKLFTLLEQNEAKKLEEIKNWYIFLSINEILIKKIDHHIDYKKNKETFNTSDNTDYNPVYCQLVHEMINKFDPNNSTLDLSSFSQLFSKKLTSIVKDLNTWYQNFGENIIEIIVSSLDLDNNTLDFLRQHFPKLKNIKIVNENITIRTFDQHTFCYKLFYDGKDNFNPITIYIKNARHHNRAVKGNILFFYKINTFAILINVYLMCSGVFSVSELFMYETNNILIGLVSCIIPIISCIPFIPNGHDYYNDKINHHNTCLDRWDAFWIVPIIFSLYCLIKENINFNIPLKILLLNRICLIGFFILQLVIGRFKDVQLLYYIATKDVLV